MKKINLKWLTLLFVAVLSVGFVSCGDDDDETEGDGKITKSMFVGSWVDSSGNYKWVLKSNGSCDYYTLEGSGTGRNVTFSLKLNSSGKWSYNESVQLLSMKTSKVGANYTIVDADRNSWTYKTSNGTFSMWTRE